MNKNIRWAAVFLGLCLICISVFLLHGNSQNGKLAVISQDGKVINTIDLSSVNTPYTIKISGSDGSYNILSVERGKIAVTEADCPDKTCVNQGYIDDGSVPIVCLPHKLTVTIKDEKSPLDAVAGGM